MRSQIGSVLLLVLGAVGTANLSAQVAGDYLDITVMRVKPEKRTEFDALSHQVAEINHNSNGDHFLAYEPFFGQQNTVYFVSFRKNYAAIDDAFGVFMGAFLKALGPAGMAKMFQDANNTSLEGHAEIRRRRWDLSANVPRDTGAANKLIAESRWLRITTIQVRPGHALQYEEQLKSLKQARERKEPSVNYFVTQNVAGGSPFTFYVTTLVKSLGDFDRMKSVPELLDTYYPIYQAAAAEAVEKVDVTLARFLPEVSNPPDDVANLDPAFWRPKLTVAPKAKAKAVKK